MRERFKAFAAAGILLLVLLAGVKLYDRAYPIPVGSEDLAEQVVKHLNAGSSLPISYQVRVYDTAWLGEQALALMELDGDLGWIRLRRGLNGQYQLAGVSYGGGHFREKIVQSGEKAYLLFGGRNAVFHIATAEFESGGVPYRLDIPATERFLVVKEISPEDAFDYFDLATLCFYDKNGRDITKDVPWN